jgi:protein-serine/threonine kinase
MTHVNLQNTLKEIEILQQLRDSKARPYVNIIEEAKAVHNELWIVSEYASGGSVNTLMKPTAMTRDPGPGLAEKFVIPIARELAQGLKYIHEAGVLHRDLKCKTPYPFYLYHLLISYSQQRPHPGRWPSTALRLWCLQHA